VERDQFRAGRVGLFLVDRKNQADNPDVIFYGGYYAQAGPAAQADPGRRVTAVVPTGDGSFDVGLNQWCRRTGRGGPVVSCPCAVPSASATQGALKAFYDQLQGEVQPGPSGVRHRGV